MKFYELDSGGNVLGAYALNQSGKTMYLLDEPPGSNYYRNGVPGDNWVADMPAIKIAKIGELKEEMRGKLVSEIGDYGDNIADVTRAIVLGEAIRLGLVTDQDIIGGYATYIDSLLQGYGGAADILNVLNTDLQALATWMVGKYYPAKASIEDATTEQEVNEITL